MQEFVFIISGLFLWILGASWLLKGAVALSLRFNIPKIVVGMTMVSLVTSIPELLLSVKAVRDGMPNLALGTVMASNMVNLGLILGIVLILFGMGARKSFYVTGWSVMMLATTLFFGFIYFDGEIQRFEGFFMLVALFLFLAYLLWSQRKVGTGEDGPIPLYMMALFLGLGGLAVWGGSEVLLKTVFKYVVLEGAEEHGWVIAVLSIGVGIPESIFAIIAVIKKQRSILWGNLLGSNMFNLLGALGVSARISPIKVMDTGLLTNDILWVMGISLILLPLLLFSKESRSGWKSGSLLLGIYLAFVYSILI